MKFQAVGPAGLTIDGDGTGLAASEEGGKLKLVAPLTGLKTGIGLRDKHLKNYLHVDKHPTATLVVERGSLKLPGDGEVVESNQAVVDSPELVNSDPFGDGWLIKVSAASLPTLLSHDEYRALTGE